MHLVVDLDVDGIVAISLDTHLILTPLDLERKRSLVQLVAQVYDPDVIDAFLLFIRNYACQADLNDQTVLSN